MEGKKMKETTKGIVGIRVRLKKKIVDLSLDEAKNFYEDLKQVFETKPEYIPYKLYEPNQYPLHERYQDPLWTSIDDDSTHGIQPIFEEIK